MINCTLEPLSSVDETTLRLWLSKGSIEILLKVLASQSKYYQAKGLKDMLDASEGNSKSVSAEGHFAEAKRYAICHEILEGLATSAEPYTIAKLS